MFNDKRGQVTIFVIIAIVIVVIGVLIYSFRGVIVNEKIPQDVEPIKEKFMGCVEDSLSLGVSLLESNGGYIETTRFEPGSRYQPFSSKLDFAGVNVPYWYYYSASGLPKEQRPSIDIMERQLESFVSEKVKDCDFEEFVAQGYSISIGDSSANVNVDSDFVDIDLNTELVVKKGDVVSSLTDHSLRYNSYLGLLFEEANSFYEKERSELFLEDYGIDALRLYLPVDGVEFTCSPLVWNADDLASKLKDSFEINYMALNNHGEDNDYYNVDFSNDVDLGVVYSNSWPTYFEVNPTDDNILIASPVGNQEGMGILGFCYVPYHYVYDVRYPVMIRLDKDSEVFQFPMVLAINKNVKGEPNVTVTEAGSEEDLCQFANTKMSISLYDSDMDPVDGEVSFECFGSRCDLGETVDGNLLTLLPQCVNGVIKVSSEGHRDSSVTYSTVSPGGVSIILDNEYERSVSMTLGDTIFSDRAIISFVSDDYSTSIVYPDQETVKLSAGDYDISVMAYSSATINIPESEKEECYTVPRSGVLGLAGLTEKECITVTVPAQSLSDALIGGGSIKYYVDDNDLEDSSSIYIQADKFKVPSSLYELQENYVALDGTKLEVSLR